MEEAEAVRTAARLRVALEMHDLGVEVMRQNLRRRFPGSPEERIGVELSRWLREPSSESGSG